MFHLYGFTFPLSTICISFPLLIITPVEEHLHAGEPIRIILKGRYDIGYRYVGKIVSTILCLLWIKIYI